MRLSKALDYFGSMKALADAVGINPSTVQAWKKSGLVPAKWEATVNQLMQQPGLKKLEQNVVQLRTLIESEDEFALKRLLSKAGNFSVISDD